MSNSVKRDLRIAKAQLRQLERAEHKAAESRYQRRKEEERWAKADKALQRLYAPVSKDFPNGIGRALVIPFVSLETRLEALAAVRHNGPMPRKNIPPAYVGRAGNDPLRKG